MPANTHAWFQQLHELCQSRQVRACVVLSGARDWQHTLLKTVVPAQQRGLWVGGQSLLSQAQSFTGSSAGHALGQETDFVVFDAHAGLEPNQLGIFSGMIKAGGLCWICLPDKTTWLNTANLAMEKFLSFPWQTNDVTRGFNQFLWQGLQASALIVTEKDPLPSLESLTRLPEALPQTLPTHDQQAALEKIHHVAFGHRHRPLLITADRGRGKSTLLGLAAKSLFAKGKQSIVITAARREQTQAALDVLASSPYQDQLRFKAPDECVASQVPCDMLMVDEAAHLPLPLLIQLTQKYSRIVFATTQQGYEGSGRGFRLKFTQELNQLTPGWQSVTLNTPIRWQANDPLEHTINQCLLLETVEALPIASPILTNRSAIEVKRYTPSDLPGSLIAPLFNLLVGAHYQTSPNDLMQLLEAPNLTFYLAFSGQEKTLVGALVAVQEGQLPPKFERRFQGHLFAQLQAKVSANPQWLGLNGLRIMRLAVLDAFQNQGIGSLLVQTLIQQPQTTHDYIASNFGATPGLVRFWHQNGFTPLHFGSKRDKASGCHAISMALGLNQPSQELILDNHQTFTTQWRFELAHHLQDLPANLIAEILPCLLSEAGQVTAFPEGYLMSDAWTQPYESVSYALQQWLSQAKLWPLPLPDSERDFLIQKLLQQKNWTELSSPQYPGRKALETRLKLALTHLKKNHPEGGL